MTELGSTGYNVIGTEHVHATTRVSVHRLILRHNEERVEEPVRIKRSFSHKGKLVRVEAEFDDLVRIIEGAKKRLGLDLTLRELGENPRGYKYGGRPDNIRTVKQRRGLRYFESILK